ncbi:lanthionine synthetase C family protein [Frankia sp. AgB1.9]|uniref:lanthionine synthetase C family protein n=1 Tax=unclassified Frankia TaxID=2632575 RepID=UPI0019330B0F|nr:MULTISPECIES: lanthionine synthetase C family protein [unclassified Frankia]MBL7487887.1 lanthionine synthetase C family protein [Frankia sp. AgW1.1]MBL7549952.1 lanthionine synthetase C family protein [Frankia sp. AgB1.9]MBL7621469.1 lanthionine synthetase C family protein [Frankia sp. AgB1.8]
MTAGQSLAEGAAGIALLHLETGNWTAAQTELRHAVAGGVSVAENASLYYGTPALAYVLATADRPGLARARATAAMGTATVTRQRLDAAHRRIDRRERPRYAEFDLIRGLTGLGVAARRIGDLDLLRDVLTYLVRLTDSTDGLPGWWCPHGPNRNEAGPPGGHSNHGIAHGITGPAALLALTLIDGVTVDGHPEAITRICQWLDTWERHTAGGSWWPEFVTLDDLARGEPRQPGPLRPSWCYGTPGIARAQQLAARALGDTTRQRNAETAFAACITDPEQLDRLTDRGLCHGTGGLLAVAQRIAADALIPISIGPLTHLHQQTKTTADESAGLLDGSAGADLATAGTTTSWDACLLLC